MMAHVDAFLMTLSLRVLCALALARADWVEHDGCATGDYAEPAITLSLLQQQAELQHDGAESDEAASLHISGHYMQAAKLLENGVLDNSSRAHPLPLSNISMQQRDAPWLLQVPCELHDLDCRREALNILGLVVFLIVSLIGVVSAFAFFREDKEEQITPICPQLVVKDPELILYIPTDSPTVDRMEVTSGQGNFVCKVVIDRPDPFRQGNSGGVAATVRIQSQYEGTFATVVARNVAVTGQGIALCRAGCEIFGFVEPDGDKRYNIRHRTGVHMLTLVGDFDEETIEGINPVGTTICWFQREHDVIKGRVLQHVDAGLVLCGLLAIRVHRNISPPVRSGEFEPLSAAQAALTQTPQSDETDAQHEADNRHAAAADDRHSAAAD